ncbi:hypothetical protein FRC00_014321 [Tulasnella sp. 408]|nr:hypothetical protein FRC00_014321 [Tulasnella sp. 408]
MVTTRGKGINFDLDSSDGELDGERDDEEPAKPAPKRRRTRQSKSPDGGTALNPGTSSGKGKEKAASDRNQLITRRNGKGGKLRDLMNMPVDIFTEVCSYLGPYDLRSLALSSKRLWDILMTKKARHTWKTALASVPDLPECLTDLNEPQYVCLLYSSECYAIVGAISCWCCRCANSIRLALDPRAARLAVPKKTGSIGFGSVQLATRRMMYSANANQRGYTLKADEPYYYIEAVKKAGREYEALDREDARGYLCRLKEMHTYRVKTGTAMLNWSHSQLASRADDIAAEKNARFESIKVRLLDMGWDEKDFPISNKEFRDLPKLEAQLENYRNYRLEQEKQQRRSERESTTTKIYHQLGLAVLNLPFEDWDLISVLPKVEEVFAIPSIELLLANDTETVTEEQWIDVATDARLFLLKWWRDCLKQLTDRMENNATAPANETKRRTKAATSKTETAEEVSTSIEDLQAKLFLTMTVWSCDGCYDENVFWFPHAIKHIVCCHPFGGMDGMINMLLPLRPDDQKLVERLLKDLELDPKTAKSEPSVEDQNEKNLLCTRCDERIAKYMSWNELIDHFREAQRWFERATEAVKKSPTACYPSRTAKSKLPQIVNDHVWTGHSALLVRQDDEKTKAAVLKLQSDFLKQGLNDPACDTKGTGGEDLEKNPSKESPGPPAGNGNARGMKSSEMSHHNIVCLLMGFTTSVTTMTLASSVEFTEYK